MKNNITFQDNFDLIKKIGSGSFGDIYLIRDKSNGKLMASKVEEYGGKKTKVQFEYKIYKMLRKRDITTVPMVHDFLRTKKFHILNLELLGDSLSDIFERNEKRLDLGTVFKLGIDMVNIIENLHKADIIHRDIKPNNFMIGKKDNNDKLYIIDFGLSKIYMKNNRHIKPSNNRSVVGTLRYISVNIHMGFEPSRRDDLESIAYMLVYFLKGKLPWQGLKKGKKKDQSDRIKEVKMLTSVEKLCEGIPDCFAKFVMHAKSLGFYESPNYDYLREILINEAKSMGIEMKYSWDR